MATATEALAPAKINLTLHVTGQRDDGYHLLDSLVVFAELADRLVFTPAERLSLRVDGAMASDVPDDERNLVWQAADLAAAPMDIVLTKVIPNGAGLGGGSSDAAAVLRHLGRADLAASIGADVPVCMRPVPQRMRGTGADLAFLRGVPQLCLVLVNPGVHLATREVFAALEHKENAPMTEMPTSSRSDWLGWLLAQRNDLEPAAHAIAPKIDGVLQALADAEVARMTGSGSTCFGIYPDMPQAQAAATRIAASHPDWWVTATRTAASAN